MKKEKVKVKKEAEPTSIDTRFTRHEVISVGDYGTGDLKEVPHKYTVHLPDGTTAEIKFQKGALNEDGSVDGLFNEDLILILFHRLKCLQKTIYACKENDGQLEALEILMGANMARRLDRVFRGVSGTHKI